LFFFKKKQSKGPTFSRMGSTARAKFHEESNIYIKSQVKAELIQKRGPYVDEKKKNLFVINWSRHLPNLQSRGIPM